MKNKNNSINEIVKVIKKAKNIALFAHINPDFDALGSALSLYYGLKSIGKDACFFAKDELTEKQESIVDVNVVSNLDCDEDKFDLFISTDTPAVARLGAYGYIFNDKNNTIVLDHHQNSGLRGKYQYINPERSSCCEICFEILEKLHVKFTKEIMELLFAGISSDTSSFINTNTNINTFKTVYKLMKHNLSITQVNQKLYRSKTMQEIKFKKYVLSNNVVINDVSYIILDYDHLKDMNGTKSDCDGFSSSLISIQGINYSFSIVEDEPNVLTVSLRAKEGYEVRSIAQAIGGGGHICAAGAMVKDKRIDDVVSQILELINKKRD